MGIKKPRRDTDGAKKTMRMKAIRYGNIDCSLSISDVARAIPAATVSGLPTPFISL